MKNVEKASDDNKKEGKTIYGQKKRKPHRFTNTHKRALLGLLVDAIVHLIVLVRTHRKIWDRGGILQTQIVRTIQVTLTSQAHQGFGYKHAMLFRADEVLMVL